MIRLALAVLIVMVLLGGGLLLRGALSLREIAGTPPAEAPAPSPDSKAKNVTGKPQPTDDSQGSFDVARIDPGGTSVFAGRAEPGSSVTILADGQPVGTVKADDNGEWTFTTEHKFTSADPELALKAGPVADAGKEAPAGTQLADRTMPQEEPKTDKPKSADTVSSQLLKSFEGMVEAARSAAKEESAAPKGAPALPPSETARSAAKDEKLAPKPPAALPPSQTAPTSLAAVRLPPSEPVARKSVPVPITFVYNEANFTDEGRKAAGLLLEYLKLKHFAEVSLTGHADERGSPEFNMNLSRERLGTVAKFLKEGGFTGELNLVPKGESEPFSGVVRAEYAPEEIFQLDRRVELVITP
jgi:outer membrane protein OmpA-like peptidoglycan-associated protein